VFRGSHGELQTIQEKDRAYSLMRNKNSYEDRNTLKIAGSKTIEAKPKRRERFNENTDSEILL